MTEDEILKLPYRPCVGIMLCNAQGGIFAGQRLDSAQDAWQMPLQKHKIGYPMNYRIT